MSSLCLLVAQKPTVGPWLNVTLSDGGTVSTKLLVRAEQCTTLPCSSSSSRLQPIVLSVQVGADGAESVVHKMAGFERVAWKYGQSAVVGTLCLDQVNDNEKPLGYFFATFHTLVISLHRLGIIQLPGNGSCQLDPLHSYR